MYFIVYFKWNQSNSNTSIIVESRHWIMPQISQHIDDSIQQHAPIVDRRNVLNQREHIETQQPHFNIAILGNADTGKLNRLTKIVVTLFDEGKSTLIDAYMSGYHGGEGETPGSFGLARVLHRWQKFIDTREESSISNRRRHRERRVPFLVGTSLIYI